MIHRDLIIVNELGLHARSAALLAKTARRAAGNVWLTKDGECVDAKEVLDIMTLGAGVGDAVRVEIETSGDSDVLEEIARLFKQGFGEQSI